MLIFTDNLNKLECFNPICYYFRASKRSSVVLLFIPEEQAENWERADVDAAARDGREDAADEAGQHEDDGVPGAKVDDAVVRLALLLPKVVVEKLAKQIEWPLMVSLQMFGKTFWYFWSSFQRIQMITCCTYSVLN